METVVKHPIGIEVRGLDIAGLDADSVDEIRSLLAEHGVMVLPDQDIDDAEFLAFMQKLGELTFATGETPVPDFPDLNIISNVGRETPPKSTFHVDTSYLRHPPSYTALRAVEIPAVGGETVFTNQYAAYETLPDDLKQKLDGRMITHVVTGLDLTDDDETEADHPVFRQHPISGRVSLYMSTPTRCVAISGMPSDEAAETVDFLYRHSTADANTFRHAWSADDVVIWDNACVMHKGDHDGVVGNRVMHRGMVTGYGEVR